MSSSPVRLSALVAALCGCLLAAAAPVRAQLVSAGPPTMTGASVDLNDLAFDEINNLYLHVFYHGNRIWGRFVNTGGQGVGDQFVISAAFGFAGWPGVAYSTGGSQGVFLVTFSTDVHHPGKSKNIYGQMVRFNGSGGELLGGPFPISPASTSPTIFQETGGISFNSTTGQFLVTWTDLRGGWEAFGRLFHVNGTPASDEVNLSAAGNFQGAPAAAFDWHTNSFLVVWKGEAAHNAALNGTWGKLVDGTSLQPKTGLIVLSQGGFQDGPGVTYLPETGKYLAYWRDEQNRGVAHVMGRVVGNDGSLNESIYPIVATPDFDGLPDGDYNWVTRTVVVTAMHGSGYVFASELNAAGTPLYTFRASNATPLPNGGSFNPHVAAGSGGQFAVGYSLNLASVWLDRWQGTVASQPGPKPGSGGGGGGGGQPITIDLNAPNGSWFFAEGVANSVFNSYFLIANPHDAPVPVRAFFANEHGVIKKAEFNVPGQSRHTVDLRAVAGDGAYGAVIQSLSAGQDIFVERSVYFGQNFEGSTTAAGTKTGLATWWFAEGSRGGEYFANYFLLLNPHATPITVHLDYYRDDGVTLAQEVTIPAQTRYTVNAGQVDGLAGRDFSTKVTSVNGEGFIAERAMYWGNPWHGGTATVGAPGPRTRWYFAEGVATSAFETVYLILNPNPSAITVRVDYQPQFGSPYSRSYTIEANRRFSVPLNMLEPNIGPVSAVFSSDVGFIAERSIYWGTNRFEGSNAVGVNAPAFIWYLPEGADGGFFDTYILLQNPSDQQTTVDVELFVEGFGKVTFPPHLRPTIAPFARETLDMSFWLWKLEQDGQAPAGSLVGRSFSARVKVFQGAPIVVEHSIYWDYRGPDLLWRSGGAEFGIPQY